MLNCKEVTWAIASEEYAEAGWFYRLKIRFHLFMCRPCHCYEGQMEDLGDSARRLRAEQVDENDCLANDCLANDCLARLESKILGRIKCREIED